MALQHHATLRRKLAVPRRGHCAFFGLLFTAFAIYGSLVPLRYTPVDWDDAVARFQAIPFLQLGVESRADWVANILLFMPIGFLWTGALALDRGRLARLVAASLVIPASTLLSVALEFTQIWFPPRTVSQNDIAAETIGSIVGVAIWLWFGQLSVNWIRTFTGQTAPKRRFEWLLQAYALGLLIYSVLPLDLTISFHELAKKYREGKIQLVPFSFQQSLSEHLYGGFTNVALFVPVGALLCQSFLRPGVRTRPLWSCAVLGVLFSATIELAQLFVYSRYTSSTDVITGTVGVVIGAALARARQGGQQSVQRSEDRRSAALGWMGAAVLYTGLLLVVFWAPFDYTDDHALIKARYQHFIGLPFEALYWGSEFHAVTEVLRKVLWFAPLGFLLGRAIVVLEPPRSVRRLLALVGIVLTAGLGVGIEIGQIPLQSHTPDLNDVLFYVAGSSLGLGLTLLLTPPTLPRPVNADDLPFVINLPPVHRQDIEVLRGPRRR